jgi:hypothetical protein
VVCVCGGGRGGGRGVSLCTRAYAGEKTRAKDACVEVKEEV